MSTGATTRAATGRRSRFDLHGRCAVVTGAGRGLGQAVSLGLAQAVLERIPAGRWGTADDIAGAAVFLGSPAADDVNGHVLVVDGGWMAR